MSSTPNTYLNNNLHLNTVEATAAVVVPVTLPPPPPPLPCASNPHRLSKNWLSQNVTEKIVYTRVIASDSSSSSEGDADEEDESIERLGIEEIWTSIQEQGIDNGGGGDQKKPIRSTSSWSSILFDQKTNRDLSNLAPPYIHPLVKKPSSSLSKQSLELCTESLGSETGTGDYTDHVQHNVYEDNNDNDQDVKINYGKKPAPPTFPPPLPSLSQSSVQLCSHQQEGGDRLILEAVSAPQLSCLHIERSDGRLVLTALESEAYGDDGYEEEEEAETVSQSSTEAPQIPMVMTPLRGCKEERRFILTWKPGFCIATS